MIPVTCAHDAKRLVKATKEFKKSKGILRDITESAQSEEYHGVYIINDADDINEMINFLVDRGFKVKEIDHRGKKALMISWC